MPWWGKERYARKKDAAETYLRSLILKEDSPEAKSKWKKIMDLLKLEDEDLQYLALVEDKLLAVRQKLEEKGAYQEMIQTDDISSDITISSMVKENAIFGLGVAGYGALIQASISLLPSAIVSYTILPIVLSALPVVGAVVGIQYLSGRREKKIETLKAEIMKTVQEIDEQADIYLSADDS
jgi:hypothetical protein